MSAPSKLDQHAPNDEHNRARAGAMEAAILETIEALTFALRGPIESWRAKALDDAMQKLLALMDEIDDARNGRGA